MLSKNPKRFQFSISDNKTIPLFVATEKTVNKYIESHLNRFKTDTEKRNLKRKKPRAVGDFGVWEDKLYNTLETYVVTKSTHEEVENPHDYVFALSDFVKKLDVEKYSFSEDMDLTPQQKYNMALGWGLAAYRFDKYKTLKSPTLPTLSLPDDIDKQKLLRELAATYFVQDLINEPAREMNCKNLAAKAVELARHFNAQSREIVGKELLNKDDPYRLIYAVGKGTKNIKENEPRLVDIRWGNPKHPAVVIAGKGVVFDTGGLNLKDDDGMATMKDDMAGAAHALGLAYLIMDADLPVNLRVMLPIVENSNSPSAFKQGDILYNRAGETIEVEHTDAEGRLILADVLYEAAHPKDKRKTPKPDLILDYGTLGWHGFFEYPGWGAVYGEPSLTKKFLEAVDKAQEYFARRPIMKKTLMSELRDTPIADLRQCNTDHPRYDDLLAMLFLEHHVGKEIDWMHFDLQPWRPRTDEATKSPPELPTTDGFAMGIRSAFEFIKHRYVDSKQSPATPAPSGP